MAKGVEDENLVLEQAREISERLHSEIRRGALVLAVLGQLQHEHYGYSLRKTLGESGLEVEEGTLYPLIRRLEKQGLLKSEWRMDNNRRKRFYTLSGLGEVVYDQLQADWQVLNTSVAALLPMPAHEQNEKEAE